VVSWAHIPSSEKKLVVDSLRFPTTIVNESLHETIKTMYAKSLNCRKKTTYNESSWHESHCTLCILLFESVFSIGFEIYVLFIGIMLAEVLGIFIEHLLLVQIISI